MADEIVFFGHDAHDPAVRRRIAALARAGAEVTAFTMRRGPPVSPPWRNVDLGRTRDADFAQRLLAMAGTAPALQRERHTLRRAKLFYARNLDMLAIARWAQMWSGSAAKLVYECLDVHRFMTRNDALGAALRAAERALLRETELVVISSPAFEREYFAKRHPGRYRAVLIENRMPAGYAYGPRPAPKPRQGPLRIGWFGNLRCRRSLALLLALAERCEGRVRIVLRGAPAEAEFDDFAARVRGHANVAFGGRYSWPEDLPTIYGGVDLVWAGDFHDPGANSKWLLPNRLYEGGYYGAVPLAPADSETGRWIAARGFGFTLAEPLERTLPAWVEAFDEVAFARAQAALAAAPDSTFLQDDNEMSALLERLRA